MYSACKLNRQSENIQPLHTHSPVWNQSIVPCPILTVASWLACSFLRRQIRWSGLYWLKVNKTEVVFFLFFFFFWNSLAFSIIQTMLAIWSLVPLPFLNSGWTSGSSQLVYCWRVIFRRSTAEFVESSLKLSRCLYWRSLTLAWVGPKPRTLLNASRWKDKHNPADRSCVSL